MWCEKGPYIIVDIQANAFVHHMVRNIVGSLIEVGAGNQPVGVDEMVVRAKRS